MNYFCPSGDEVSDRLGDGDRAGESSEQPFRIGLGDLDMRINK